MSRRIVALFVGFGFVLAPVGAVHLGAAERVGRDGLMITKPGTYRLYRGELHLKIFEDKGKLNYEIVRTFVVRSFLFWRTTETWSHGPSEPFIEKGPTWFAYVEQPRAKSPHAIWIFDGRGLLKEIAYDPSESRDDYWGASLYDSDSRPTIVTKAPKEVRDQLPKEFKKKFPMPKK